MATPNLKRNPLQIVLTYNRVTGIYPPERQRLLFRFQTFGLFLFLTINTVLNMICQYVRTDTTLFIATLTSFYSSLNYCYVIGYLNSYVNSGKVRRLVRDLAGIEGNLRWNLLTFKSTRKLGSYMVFRLVLVVCSLVPKVGRQIKRPPAEPFLMGHLLFLFCFEPIMHLSTHFQQYALFTRTGDLSNYMTSKLTKLVSRIGRPATKRQFNAVLRNHMNIVKLCHDLNSIYGFYFLISTGSTFLQLTIDAAYLFSSQDSLAPGLPGLVLFIVETAYLFATLIYDVWSAVDLKSAVEKFEEKLNELYISDTTGILLSDKVAETVTCNTTNLSFSADKFFEMDKTLFLSMIGAMASFIIIIMQLFSD